MPKELSITGKVIRGEGYGQKLGFPTANLDRRGYSRCKYKIRLGIYAGTARILAEGVSPLSRGALPSSARGVCFPAAIVIGPVDRRGLPKIEAYLIGFTGVLYGERVVLSLKEYLRPYMSFRDQDVLKGQILKDIQRVRRIISLTE